MHARRVTHQATARVIPLQNLADRVWYALHCLPRDDRRRPPAPTIIEAQAGLPRGALGRLFRDERRDMRAASLRRLAPVLRVSVGWLASGEGEAPPLSGPYWPREPHLRESPDESGPEIRTLRLGGPDDDDPLPARAAAAAFARANGIDERAIRSVQQARARGYTAEEWYASIKCEAAALREADDDPGSVPPS